MSANQAKEEGNFFQRLFSSLFGSKDPEAEKKRQLKSIAKELGKTRYSKFYKYSTDEALPVMAKFFHDIYKIIGPAQVMFQSIQNPNALTNGVIIFNLSKNQIDILERLDEKYILEEAKHKALSEISASVKADLNAFCAEFDLDKINAIDMMNTKLQAFKSFCNFDYFFLLKKFDSRLHERDFAYIPHFDAIRAEYILDDLKDFISMVRSIPIDSSWKDVMAMLKQMRGIEPIAIGNWTKIIARLRDLISTNAVEMMIQLISKDPKYVTTYSDSTEHIAESYLDKIRNQSEAVLKKLEKEKANNRIGEILNFLFGTNSIQRLKHYSASENAIYVKKGMSGFPYAEPLNYLQAFITDFVNKDVKEFTDLVLIRGKWSTATMSNQFSEVYHQILSNGEKLKDFDDSLAEDHETGMKLKTWLLRCDKDRETARLMTSVLNETNETAYGLLTSCSQQLISYGRTVKNLLNDHERLRGEMVINWKELDRFSERPIKEHGVQIYQKIYQFITMMQYFLGKNSSSENNQ